MREWLAHLRVNYPLRMGAHPQRPWWRKGIERNPYRTRTIWEREGGWIVRLDLPSIPDMEEEEISDTQPFEAQDEWHRVSGTGLLVVMAEVDRLHPIAHPGFRAGQVWCIEDAQRHPIVVSIGADTRFPHPEYASRFTRNRGLALSSPIQIPVPGEVGKSVEMDFVMTGEPNCGVGEAESKALKALWRSFTSLPMYLLSDPICPTLAPWASPSDT